MTPIRLHCVIDELSRGYEKTIRAALEEWRADILVPSKGTLDLQYDLIYQDLSNVPWVFYTYIDDQTGQPVKEDMGFDFGWLAKDTKKIWEAKGWTYDCIVYVVDQQNWHSPGVGGWNLGGFYNNYQVQLVKGKDFQRGLYLTFAMEVFHSMDDFIFAELGKNVEEILEVEDFDRDVVHGLKAPPYYVFQYRPAVEKMQFLMVDTFEKRLKKQLASLISFYLTLLRQYLAYLKKSKAAPVLDKELVEN